MANPKHTHKYHRIVLNGYTKVWACARPECNHYMPVHMAGLIPGKLTQCWGIDCENTTIMDPRTMKMDRPLCPSCDPSYIELDEQDMNKISKMFEERGK